MKKILSLLILTILSSQLLFANIVLKVGASPVPHAEVLENIKPLLKEKGIDLKIVEFNEYVTPNLALANKDLDANFFQHIPYLEKFKRERNLKLSQVGDVLIGPIALYSKKHKSLDELNKKDTIAIPNDPSNGGRALILLHNKGIITLADPTNLFATEFDIIKNPKKLKFKSLEAPQLPRVLDDVDFAVINSNYAIQGGLSPVKDALLREDKNSPYVNVVAVRQGDEQNETVLELVNALRSQKSKDFILKKYQGSIIPTF
ncbi:MAG: MetQ/NlpA family ABC transporter substrate-binding protein [Fusobacterium sp. JB019]|nr:MetQ/NlpA family ABC transporter substrate-binding protein [Fusobacterium sp. JB019]MDP0506591.1 MetQ/NlpA family ABC transporter substrate-binding protein [Fusobacterium sp. JB019]